MREIPQKQNDALRIAEELFVGKVKRGSPPTEHVYKNCLKEAEEIINIIKSHNKKPERV